MIPVTRSFLPPFKEYTDLLGTVWDTHQLTNGGRLLQTLINELSSFLQVPHLLVTTNGTLSLQIAIRALELKGEIITTPFSYIATSSAIMWEGCKPVFADIEPDYWCIDPAGIERVITPKTSAILATHVFGNPCDIEGIAAIAHKYKLKVIYDGAHSFGVNYRDKSIFSYGDISVCSFHATKLFHTAEGGCLITPHQAVLDKLVWLHNSGHNGEEAFYGLGINGKANELQAALGLAVLPYVNTLIESRKQCAHKYDTLLDPDKVKRINIRQDTSWNYSYYPVLMESELKLLEVKHALNKAGIFPRRYFYPALNTLGFLQGTAMPVAEDIASRVLCLPLYHDLEVMIIERITGMINDLL